MKRPAFQFYPGDWTANAKLKRCTHAERGIWMSVLCLFHDSEEAYGVLHWPLKDLAQAVGCKLTELKSLRDKGVLKGADKGETCDAYIYRARHAGKDGDPITLLATQPGPVWYSSRMVRDEYKANVRAGNARENSPIGQPKPPPDVPPKDPPKPTKGEEPKGGIGDVSSSSSFGLRSSSSVKALGRVDPEKPPLPPAKEPVLLGEWVNFFTREGFEPAIANAAKLRIEYGKWVDRAVTIETVRKAMSQAHARLGGKKPASPAYYVPFVAYLIAPTEEAKNAVDAAYEEIFGKEQAHEAG